MREETFVNKQGSLTFYDKPEMEAAGKVPCGLDATIAYPEMDSTSKNEMQGTTFKVSSFRNHRLQCEEGTGQWSLKETSEVLKSEPKRKLPS